MSLTCNLKIIQQIKRKLLLNDANALDSLDSLNFQQKLEKFIVAGKSAAS